MSDEPTCKIVWSSEPDYEPTISTSKFDGTPMPISFGPAINSTVELEYDTLWIENDEYSSQVNFCPMTGYKAKIQVKVY